MLANDYASDCKDSQDELWHRISKDEYMAYAVKECYYSAERILNSIVDGEGKLWYDFLLKDEVPYSPSLDGFPKLFLHFSLLLCPDTCTGLNAFSKISMRA